MYSTSIRNNKCLVECIIVGSDVNMIKFIMDTGAMFTCCNSKTFDIRLYEKDMADREIKLLGGFVKGSSVKFYKCRMRQFTIGNVDMGEQNIWITFDERVTDAVLGMDILQQVIFAANPYNKKMYFCKDADDYNDNFELKAV